MLRQVCACCFVASLTAVAGCSRGIDSEGRETRSEKPNVARTQIERGPVLVTVEVEPHPARLSEEPVLTLTIEHELGVQVDRPAFGEAVGDFLIRDYREPLPTTRNQRQVLQQIYTLEPVRTGDLQISPITVSFTDQRSSGDGKEHTIQTEALGVNVTSTLDAQAPSLDDLRGMTGPMELPQSADRSWLWILAAAVVVLGGSVSVWYGFRRGKAVEQRRLTPQELAFLELDELLHENLGQSDVKQFYVRLTGIVRRYIERTTNVHAPEQTTEEFLHEISTGQVFAPAERLRLKSFLESADLVKFAAYQPTARDIEETFERAKVFIGLEQQEVAA